MAKTWKNEFSKPQKNGHGKKWRLHWGWSRRKLRPYGLITRVGYGGEFYRPGKRNPYYVNTGQSPGEIILTLNNKSRERVKARKEIWNIMLDEWCEIDKELWILEDSGLDFDSVDYSDFESWLRLGKILRRYEI